MRVDAWRDAIGLTEVRDEIMRRIESMDYWKSQAAPGEIQTEMYGALAAELRSLKDYVETQIVRVT